MNHPAVPSEEHHSNSAYVYAFFMTIIGSTAAAALKFVGSDVSVEFITFCQYAICMGIILFTLWQQKISWQSLTAIDKEDRWAFLIRGLSGLLGFYAFYWAVTEVPLVDAILLRHSSPLFVPVIAFLWLGLKTNKGALLAIALGFVGVFITLRPDAGDAQWGHLLGLASAVFLAGSMVSTNRLKKYNPTMVLFYYYAISLVGSLPVGLLYWQEVTLTEGLIILYIGASIHLALYFYTKAFTLSSAAVVAPMTYLSVVHAGILGWMIWGHVPALWSIVGMVLVVACGVLTTLLGPRRDKVAVE